MHSSTAEKWIGDATTEYQDLCQHVVHWNQWTHACSLYSEFNHTCFRSKYPGYRADAAVLGPFHVCGQNHASFLYSEFKRTQRWAWGEAHSHAEGARDTKRQMRARAHTR